MTELTLLKKSLQDMYQRQDELELSDDFCYTNGKMAEVEAVIKHLRNRIDTLQGE